MRILVVEDEQSLSSTLKRGLEAEGYVVDVVGDGAEGLWMATEHEFDAVLLDVMLPGLNGFLVARRLREAGNTVPILMLTAVDGELDQADALNDGADDYLTKPFSFDLLLARLRAIIRRASGHSSSVVSCGNLSLNVATHRVWRGNTEIELTAKEFTLLHYLASRRGALVSKTELLRHVWEEDSEISMNAVEVYVGYLRKKIDLPFGESSLETVRGRGYRLAGGEI
ncbi:MAG TPA: DNA-binding response regulator [Acidimicrobiaceae bacterium]|nr:DNA-binding response regulator [Acidimicrobiaceae bacterium]